MSAFTCNTYPDFEDENHHYKVYFENCWDKPIIIWSSRFSHVYGANDCEMYVPYEELICRYDNQGKKIPPGGINNDYIKSEIFYENCLKEWDSLYIAVFYNEQTILNDSLSFLVSYLLSLNDLQKVDFHITYPPKENMKDVHMWPSFEEVIERSRSTYE